MDAIFRAVAKLKYGNTPIDGPAAAVPFAGSTLRGAASAGTASELVATALSSGPTDEESRQIAIGYTSAGSTPFALDTLRLDNLLAPDGNLTYYEQLVANFHSRYDAESIQTIQFVATNQGAGCSTTAFNFALALALYPHTMVLFIDADFRAARRPNLPGGRLVPSLSNLAVAGSDGRLPVFPVSQSGNFFMVPSGNAIVAPLTLFRSKAFEKFMLEMSGRFTHIVIDTPPLQVAPESVFLSSRVNGVILVLDCDRSRRGAARRVKEKIEGAGGKMLGAVLNRRRYYIPEWLYRRLWPHAAATLR